MNRGELDTGEDLQLASALDEMVTATDRLLLAVDTLDDQALREPSGLPGWTRAHVLTHLARNADGLANLVAWARSGEEVPMYAGGRAGRDADIDAGAGRHIGDIRLDLNDSAERLLEAFADFPEEALTREVTFVSGATAYGGELPLMRVRELEIHHVDLGWGYTAADWSEAFATRTLDQVAPQFLDRDCPVTRLEAGDGRAWTVGAAGPVLRGDVRDLAAWLVGRRSTGALDVNPAGPLPSAPRWV